MIWEMHHVEAHLGPSPTQLPSTDAAAVQPLSKETHALLL